MLSLQIYMHPLHDTAGYSKKKKGRGIHRFRLRIFNYFAYRKRIDKRKGLGSS